MLCHPLSENIFCSLKPSLCTSKRVGEGKPWEDVRGHWGLGLGSCTGAWQGWLCTPGGDCSVAIIAQSPLRMLESTGEDAEPVRAPVQATPSEKPRVDVFSEHSEKQQPGQVSSLPAGRESRSRRADSSGCLGPADIHQHCWALAAYTAHDQHLQISLLLSAAGAEGLDDSQHLMLNSHSLMEGGGILRWLFKPVHFTWIFLTYIKLSPFLVHLVNRGSLCWAAFACGKFRVSFVWHPEQQLPITSASPRDTHVSNWCSTRASYGLSLMIPGEQRHYSPFPQAAEPTGESGPELFVGEHIALH